MVPCFPKGLACDTGVALVVVASVCLEVPLLGSYPLEITLSQLVGSSHVTPSSFYSLDLINIISASMHFIFF
jgi:hypothetical protein